MSTDDLFIRLQLAMKKIETSMASPIIEPNEDVSQLYEKLELAEAKNRSFCDKISYTDAKLASLQLKLEQMIEGLT
jgi:predicted RecB family endonuclease